MAEVKKVVLSSVFLVFSETDTFSADEDFSLRVRLETSGMLALVFVEVHSGIGFGDRTRFLGGVSSSVVATVLCLFSWSLSVTLEAALPEIRGGDSYPFNKSPNDFCGAVNVPNPLEGPLKPLKPKPRVDDSGKVCADIIGFGKGFPPSTDDDPNTGLEVPRVDGIPNVGVVIAALTGGDPALANAETGVAFTFADAGLKNGEELGFVPLSKAPKPDAGLNNRVRGASS